MSVDSGHLENSDRRRDAPAQGGAEPGRVRSERPLWCALLVVALVLAAMTDDRHVGEVADGRQMIRTAIALAESGTIGQARDRDFTLPREGGDAVSRFGMGMSLLQVPAAFLAPWIEARRGPSSSQFVFLLVPFGAVLLAAWASGRIVRLLGGSPRAAAWAVVLAALGSPLGSYAAMEFSEPVQAAALTGALCAAVAAATAVPPRLGSRLSVVAGAAAGFAVLVKTSLLAVAPWTLLPLLSLPAGSERARAVARAAAGAAPFLGLWALFDLLRFGQLLGGYPDDRFTHPFFDGLWRLVLGPNRGLVVFFPASVFAALWAAGAVRRRAGRPAFASTSALLVTATLLLISAGYWGWHGLEGWGPRFLVPAMPALAALAVLWFDERPAWWGRTLIGVSCALNVLPLVQHPTPVATYVMNCQWPEIPPDRADDYPSYVRDESSCGAPTVVPFAVLEQEAWAAGMIVYPWFLAANLAGEETLQSRLASPPWRGVQPGIVPYEDLLEPGALRVLVPRARLGFLGRSLFEAGEGSGYAAVYADGLLDQVVRAQQLGDKEAALSKARKLASLQPGARSDILLLESLRINGRKAEALAYLHAMPAERQHDPGVHVVLALFERDAGNEQGARALLATVVGAFPSLPVERALSQPMSQWPATLHGMTNAVRRGAVVAAPRPM